jgi:hypothetical protein
MINHTKQIKFAFILFFIFISSVTLAQKTATSIITIKVPEALSLSVTGGNSVDFDFTSDLTLLTSGIEKINAVTLTYQSNRPWFLNINATTANFNGGDGSNPMPSSIIQFKNTAGGTYVPLSTTSVSLSGTTDAKNPKGSSTVGIDYKITPGLSYPPSSDYTIGVTYTISTI